MQASGLFLPPANGQLPAPLGAIVQCRAGVERGGSSSRFLSLSSFRPGEHFVPSAVKAPLCRQVSIPRAEEAETSSRHLARFHHFLTQDTWFSGILFRSCLLSLKCSGFFFHICFSYSKDIEKKQRRGDTGREGSGCQHLNIKISIASLVRVSIVLPLGFLIRGAGKEP